MNYESLTDRELVSWAQSQSLMIEPLFAELVSRLEVLVGEPTIEDELEAAEEEIQQLEKDVEDYKNCLEAFKTQLDQLTDKVEKVIYDGPESEEGFCTAAGAATKGAAPCPA